MKDFVSKKGQKLLLITTTGLLFLCSCGSMRQLQDLPPVNMTTNHYEYSIQNMDGTAQCNALTAIYEGFNVSYSLNSNRQMIITIENKTNKSLIIDKSKCYVLYDGYSKDLFKNVRSGRSTTYNNVQDAIDNVQTNESSITMSIPPYSKWNLPVEESNVTESRIPSLFYWDAGNHPLTAFSDDNPTIEFVIPYTFDYALAKWFTSRNKLFVGNIRVEKSLEKLYSDLSYGQTIDRVGVSSNEFYRTQATSNDLMSYFQTKNYNKMIEEHNKKVEKKKDGWTGVAIVGVAIGAVAVITGFYLLIGALIP